MGTPTLLDLAARAATTSSTASATGTSVASKDSRPPVYHVVGIILAISSGLFIGVSFVIKKVGLLKANKKYNEAAGDGYGYLKNAWWWLGMTLMIIGEICNFVAYAFVDAILVTPMGSLSVVVTTILSAIFLKERLSFVGKVGCFMCIVGSVIIVLNAPTESSVANIQEMQSYVITPGFLTYAGVLLVGCAVIAFWAGPRYGKKSMLVYLSVCSLIGGLSVVATQGLGAAIIAQIAGESQFKHWFLYVLFVFVICTLLTEIVFLNKALNIFNAALVTPTYYVYFTSATIITSAILFQGFKGTAQSITTIVMGFLVICAGVVLLQLSKSAKDVPDTAVFKGDLDQVRTMGEQEEPESEPKADAIRGGAAIMRALSKSHLRKEAEEVRRIHTDSLEPIGEDEQVEWDGLRRRKTIIQPGTPSIRRQRTIHPPLGMSHFPDHASDASSHDPENDISMFPNFRRRAQTVLGRKGSHASSHIDPKADPRRPTLSTIPSGRVLDDLGDDYGTDLGHPHVYGMPDDLKRHTSIGLTGMHGQDTSYRSPGVHGSTVSWAPPPHPSHLSLPTSSVTPGPTPPPHQPRADSSRRQFSFANAFRGSSSSRPVSSDHDRPDTARSTSSVASFPKRVFSGFGRSRIGKTEEERLGLVTGDSRIEMPASAARRATDGVHDVDFYPEMETEEPDAYSDTEYPAPAPDLNRGKSRRSPKLELDEGYDDAAFDESPERISSSESGGYSKVRRRRSDEDFSGPPARGAAFV